MKGLDDHYRSLLAHYQGQLDAQAAQEEYELSPEDEAFMKSYMSCIAIGSENDVIEFLKHDLSGNERDVFMACHVFTSIEEAWFMWQDAIKFMKDKQK
jgi:hypothetical protein